jgi:DNA-directed RNA polymerase specialized sigma24 family protein
LLPKVTLDKSHSEVARDYDDFCAHWEDRIRHIVFASNAFKFEDVDDIVQDLMLEFYTNDGLGQFDPTQGTKFSTWVHGFAAKRLLGKRDKAVRRWWREGLSLNEVLADEGEKDFLGELETAPADVSIEFIDMVLSVYRQLKRDKEELEATSPKGVTTINDYPKLFACIVQQILYGLSEETIAAIGEKQASRTGHYGVNRKALAYEMGLSNSAITTMLARLAKRPSVRSLLGRS